VIPIFVVIYWCTWLFIAYYEWVANLRTLEYAMRRATFWPLYVIRWFIASLVLAIKGK